MAVALLLSNETGVTEQKRYHHNRPDVEITPTSISAAKKYYLSPIMGDRPVQIPKRRDQIQRA